MSGGGTWKCPGCQGVVRSAPRRNATLEDAIRVHERDCPAVRSPATR